MAWKLTSSLSDFIAGALWISRTSVSKTASTFVEQERGGSTASSKLAKVCTSSLLRTSGGDVVPCCSGNLREGGVQSCQEGTDRKRNDDGGPAELAPSDLQEERPELEHTLAVRVNAGLRTSQV